MGFKLVAIADIHGSSLALMQSCHLARERQADALLIAGDLCLHQVTRHFVQLLPEAARYANCPVILTPGNHDYFHIEKTFTIPDNRFPGTRLMSGTKLGKPVICLIEGVWEWNGVKFWGSPYISYIDGKWNYERKRNEERYEIPDDTDIILTHNCPFGYGDSTTTGEQIGSEALTLAIRENPDIKCCFYGHNHDDYGWEGRINDTMLYNVSCHDEDLTYKPQGVKIIELCK
jgi:Icc-related predicted phosphoesterase